MEDAGAAEKWEGKEVDNGMVDGAMLGVCVGLGHLMHC